MIQGLRAGVATVRATVTSVSTAPASARSLAAASAFPLGSVPTPQLASPWSDSPAGSMVWSDLLSDPDSELADSLPLTRSTAMSVPAVSRARTLVAATIARTPFIAPDGTDETRAFLANPSDEMSPWLLKLWTADDLVFYGVSWWQILARYSSTGKPRRVRRILPGGVALQNGGGVTVYDRPVSPHDLIRTDGPHEGLLNYAGGTVRRAYRLELTAADRAENPAHTIDLHQTAGTPLEDNGASLIETWRGARRKRGGTVGYTSPNIEARVLGGDAGEILLSKERNSSAIDVARHTGVPADAIDASVEHASMTYGNVETKLRVLIDFGITHYADAIAARLSMDDVTPRGTVVSPDYSGLTVSTDNNPATTAPPAPAAPAGGNQA